MCHAQGSWSLHLGGETHVIDSTFVVAAIRGRHCFETDDAS